jgi:CRISPR-associated endonuclease/helicase Cas3
MQQSITAFAHSRNAQGRRHGLEDHLRGVGQLAADFAERLGAREAGYYLGLWHDIGKFAPGFQRYLLAAEQGSGPGGSHPDHKAAGALLAMELLSPLALPLQGHHGGLTAPAALKTWLNEHADEARLGLQMAEAILPDLRPSAALSLPDHVQRDPLAAEMLLRLLFSALVDADYLDTERHFDPDSARARGHGADLGALWRRFQKSQTLLTGHQDDVVNQTRHAIYQACLAAAAGPTGLYSLTVPTGGGKTRSAMAFALRHALTHGLERVIVAIPYLSITEQTVRVYRQILDGGDSPVVLEHHSGTSFGEDEMELTNWTRLAAENWDAPVVVTTTVQLFDSLFSNRPGATRKLHRLANAVIVLDEVQALPPHRLTPILNALQHLTAYHTTVVLSTATQPSFDAIPGLQDLQAREIVPQPERHFLALERVRYEWRLEEPMTWVEVADEMLSEAQALVIVNTRRDAQALYAEVRRRDPAALHLSAAMCGLHKARVLDEIRRRLIAGEPCRVVSTQVVEAGVDLDFPLVLRALGPLDAIIQAAGRCNREGRLAYGRAVVFVPADGHLPPGVYHTATGLARAVLGTGLNPNSPEALRPYFARLFTTIDADADQVQACRARLDYVETARRFHLIDDESEPVVVSYGTEDEQEVLTHRLDHLAQRRGNPRSLWRALQPYMVSLPRRQVERAIRQGLAVVALPGLVVWRGAYDPQVGLLFEVMPGEAFIY